ncbi:hypothetical protein G6F65_015858 [Rhizopus arrhizus]|nr:hypothetical protein G6F65_015858 [Rhizopus arrhizus]
MRGQVVRTLMPDQVDRARNQRKGWLDGLKLMAVRAVAYGIDRHDADQVGLGQQARGQRKLVDRQHGVALVAVGGQFVVNQGGSAQQADNQVPGAQEVIQRKARQREQRMALAHRAHVGQGFQGQGAQRRAEVRIHACRHVDFTLVQQRGGVIQRIGVQVDADVRRHRLLLDEQRPDHLVGHVIGHGQAEHRLRAGGVEFVALQSLCDAGKRVADGGPQQFGALGGQHPALPLHAQWVLQRQAQAVDGIADRRLRHVQRECRARDVALGHDGVEDAKQVQVDGVKHSSPVSPLNLARVPAQFSRNLGNQSMIKNLKFLAAACVAALAASQAAAADNYPTKPITIILPYATGGSADMLARFAAQAVQSELGQPSPTATPC